MREVIAGVSPDYSIVAQKKGGSEKLNSLASVFQREYGMGIDQLLVRWDQRFDRLETSLEQVQNELRSIYESKSWRLTAPLRKLFALFRGR